jgi:NADH:ubiquinone oxidoreductase subunit 4 (subunit M)
MALLLPQAALLGGMVLSSLVLRYRVRTVAGLSGAGTMIAPLRLAFLLAAFQGMSLPLVGGFMAEWRLLLGIWSLSPLLGAGILAGLFFSFSLVLSFLRTIFSGEGPSLSRGDGEIVKTLWPGELMAFGTAAFFLLLTDFVSTRGGIFGGSP